MCTVEKSDTHHIPMGKKKTQRLIRHDTPAMNTRTTPTIGFIGQGYVGKNTADNFEARGFPVVRYALEEPYVANKEKIQECDVVFVAVPTPTTPDGFDDSILRSVVPLVGVGKTLVIKSTVLPGTTEALQAEHPGITILFSPEFLLERTAAHDASFPIMNLIGIPSDSAVFRKKAEEVIALLPESPYSRICAAREAEIFKYVHNIHGVFRILFANLIYNFATAQGVPWEAIPEAMAADPYMNAQASYYNNPVHKSGRGAGGHCFIKDLAAFVEAYQKHCGEDSEAIGALAHLEQFNTALLRESGKDLDLLAGVYGDAARTTQDRTRS